MKKPSAAWLAIVLCAAVILMVLVLKPAPEPVQPVVWTAPVRMAPPAPHVMIPPLPEPETVPELAANVTPALPGPEDIVAPTVHKPRIAIVIDDMGLNLTGSARAIKLPPAITLSYLSYAPNILGQTDEAKAAGHQLLLHMPMEPMGHNNPGPEALLVDLPMDELHARFEKALNSFNGFVGVNNHMGSKFTAWPDGMKLVVDMLKQRELFFLDSRTGPHSVATQIAHQEGLPVLRRDVFLDDDMGIKMIKRQLAETENIAQHHGQAIAIGHPHTSTLEALEEWIPEAEQRGYELVPIKTLLK